MYFDDFPLTFCVKSLLRSRSYVMRYAGGKDRPAPICDVSQYEAHRADLRASGRSAGEISWAEAAKMMFVELACKDFNIEIQVDPSFIHGVTFGWNAFMSISAAQMREDLETARSVFKQQPEYRLIETRCNELKSADFPITNIVVLGWGSNCSKSDPHGAEITALGHQGYYGLSGSPIGQLATVMEIRRLLGGTSRRPGLRPLKGK